MQHQFALLATPSYQGDIQDLCAGSIMRALRECYQAGILAEWIPLSGSPYVETLRNMLVREFLETPLATDLVFIDSDVGFEPDALPRLLQYDADVVGGRYPFKSDAGGFPGREVRDERGMPWVREVALLNGDGTPKLGQDGEPMYQALAECHVLPTGFLRIRRSVFERFREHYSPAGELDVIEREESGAERGRYTNFFETRQIGDLWFGEDVWFCQKWREMGGMVLLDPDIHFTHTGRKHWKGNYHEYRMRLPGGAKHEPDELEYWKDRALASERRFQQVGLDLQAASGHASAILKPLDNMAPGMTVEEATAKLEALGQEQAASEGNGTAAPEGNGRPGTAAPGEYRTPCRVDIMGGNGSAVQAEVAEAVAQAQAAHGIGTDTLERPFEPGPELLLGCGDSRFKVLIPPGGSPRWHELTTLDMNPDCRPDVRWDLNDPGQLPFRKDHFAEIHAYEVLEHLGAPGEWREWFRLWAELWRILRPGGYVLGDVPAWDSEDAWGDPSHARVIPPKMFAYLCQSEYRRQVGLTMLADFRSFYKADFRVISLHMDPAEYVIDPVSNRGRRADGHPNGRFTRFVLQAIKPSTWSEADRELVEQHRVRREEGYQEKIAQWEARQATAGVLS